MKNVTSVAAVVTCLLMQALIVSADSTKTARLVEPQDESIISPAGQTPASSSIVSAINTHSTIKGRAVLTVAADSVPGVVGPGKEGKSVTDAVAIRRFGSVQIVVSTGNIVNIAHGAARSAGIRIGSVSQSGQIPLDLAIHTSSVVNIVSGFNRSGHVSIGNAQN